MASYYIFWHYFNIKCSSVQFHYDQVSNFTFPSVNLIWKKCPIRIEFLDTDFWFPKNVRKAGAPLLCVQFYNINYPLCYWSIFLVCFYSSFYEYFVQKKLIGNQK